MEKFFRAVINRVKGIKLDHIQEKASQFGNKAKKAVNDIDIEGLNFKKQEIFNKIDSLRDKARLKLEQIEEESKRKKIDRDIAKALKDKEKKRIREELNLKVVLFFKNIAKVLVLIVLILIFINILFKDEVKQFNDEIEKAAMEKAAIKKEEQKEMKNQESPTRSWEKYHSDEISNYVNQVVENPDDIKGIEGIERSCRNRNSNQEDYEKCMYMAGKEIGKKILRDN